MHAARLVVLAAFSVAAAMAAEPAPLAQFESITNFSACAKPVKEAFKRATGEAVAKGDFETLGKLFDYLSRSKIDQEVYALWYQAAEQLNDDALTARQRKPEAQQELIAGFREGGSTFGLNTARLETDTGDLGRQFAEAARSVLEKRMPQQDLTPRLKLQRDLHLLAFQQKTGSRQEQLDACAVVEADAFKAVPATRDETNLVGAAINTVLLFRLERKDWKAYHELWDRVLAERADIYPSVKAARLGAKANAYSQAQDEAAFEAVSKEIDKLPLDKDTLRAVANATEAMARRADSGSAQRKRLWQRLIDNRAAFETQERLQILETMFGFADTTGRRRLPKGPIDAARAVWDEAVKLEAETTAAWNRQAAAEAEANARKEPFTRDPAIQRVNLSRLRTRWIGMLKTYHLWDEALALVAADAAAPRAHINTRLDGLRLAYLADDRDMCRTLYAGMATNAQLNASQKFNAGVLLATGEAKDQKDFAERVAALRGNAEVPAYFNQLRDACKSLYELRSDVAMSEFIGTLVGMSADLLWPEERVEYTATFVGQAPATAEGAYARGLFSKLKTDNRMGRYAVWDWQSKTKEVARLKSAPKPDLAANTPGKEAAVCACYDDRGVHFYLKLNDPDAWKVRAGLEDKLYMECSVQTGNEAPWSWLMLSALSDKTNDLEWDSPTFGRKMARDYVKSDIFVADDCFVVHIFAPWLLAYDRLPTGENELWRFVAVAGWGGQFGSLGGGSVHELGRGMHLRFEMPPAARDKVRLGVLRAAAGEYLAFRRKWENTDFWSDPNMGDPAFAEAVVKPYLQALDEAAKEAAAPDLDKAAVDRLFQHLRDFTDCRLSLDAKRAAYIKSKLFADESRK